MRRDILTPKLRSSTLRRAPCRHPQTRSLADPGRSSASANQTRVTCYISDVHTQVQCTLLEYTSVLSSFLEKLNTQSTVLNNPGFHYF